MPRVGRAVDLVPGERRATVGGRCAPGERDLAVAGCGQQVLRGAGGRSRSDRRRTRLVRKRADTDSVRGHHLVVDGGAVLEARVDVARARGRGDLRRRLLPGAGRAVDLVPGERRATVGGRCAPGERDLAVAGCGQQVLRGAGGGRGNAERPRPEVLQAARRPAQPMPAYPAAP